MFRHWYLDEPKYHLMPTGTIDIWNLWYMLQFTKQNIEVINFDYFDRLKYKHTISYITQLAKTC